MTIKVRYIGEDRADIRYGEEYTAKDIKDDNRYYAIIDRSGESYAYPKTLFEIVKYGAVKNPANNKNIPTNQH